MYTIEALKVKWPWIMTQIVTIMKCICGFYAIIITVGLIILLNFHIVAQENDKSVVKFTEKSDLIGIETPRIICIQTA